MATQQQTIDFLLEQLTSLPDISARKMFGEYGLYHAGKLVALIADDQLYLKPTKAGRALLESPTEAPPYPGARPALLIEADQWDDREWLANLITTTAAELPMPAAKRKKN